METEKVFELKCVDDINTFFTSNVLDEISDEEEIAEYISELSILGKSYQDIHTDLSNRLDGAAYKAQYPKQKEVRDDVNTKIQNAKRKLRNVKRSKNNTKITDKQSEILPEKKFLLERTDDVFAKSESNVSNDFEELRYEINFLENHVADCQKLWFKIENIFKEPESHVEELLELEKKAKDGMVLLQKRLYDSKKEFDAQRQNDIDDENQKVKESNEVALNDQAVIVEHVFKEIEIRCDSFQSRIDKNAIKSLSGHQLMEA